MKSLITFDKNLFFYRREIPLFFLIGILMGIKKSGKKIINLSKNFN